MSFVATDRPNEPAPARGEEIQTEARPVKAGRSTPRTKDEDLAIPRRPASRPSPLTWPVMLGGAALVLVAMCGCAGLFTAGFLWKLYADLPDQITPQPVPPVAQGPVPVPPAPVKPAPPAELPREAAPPALPQERHDPPREQPHEQPPVVAPVQPPPQPMPQPRPQPAPPAEGPKEAPQAAPWEVKPDPVADRGGQLNLNGSVPLTFMGMVVPSTSPQSAFVAVTAPGTKDKNQLQVYDLRTMKPVGTVLHGQFDGFGQQLVVSPDGDYLATVLPKTTTVEVFSVKTGRSVQRIQVDADPKMFVQLVDFAGKDRVFTAKHQGQFPLDEVTTVYQVWDVQNGAQVAEFSYGLRFIWKWATFSPGRKYLVMENTDNDKGYRILAWDLTTGKSAGEFVFQGKNEPWGQAAGLAFTPDGEKLAMLWRLGKKPDCWGRILCWDFKTGKKLLDYNVGYDLPMIDSLWFKGGTHSIQWVPDGSGWLLFGHLLIDAGSGAVVYKVGAEPNFDGVIVDRRFLDRDHVTSVEGGAFDKRLAILTLPRAEIDRAARNAQMRAGAPK